MIKLAGSEAPEGFEVIAEEMGWVGVVTNAAQFAETQDQKYLVNAMVESAMLILFAADPIVLIIGAAALYTFNKNNSNDL